MNQRMREKKEREDYAANLRWNDRKVNRVLSRNNRRCFKVKVTHQPNNGYNPD